MPNTESCKSNICYNKIHTFHIFYNPLLTSVKTSKRTSEHDPSWNTTGLQQCTCLPEYVFCGKGGGEDKRMKHVISQSNLNT